MNPNCPSVSGRQPSAAEDSGRVLARDKGKKRKSQGAYVPAHGARSEQTIRVTERRYRRLFESAKGGMLILETETGRIRDVNPFLSQMLGFSHDELVGTPLWELGPFCDIASNKAKFEQLQEQGYVRYEILPLETRDRRQIAVEFVSNVHRSGDYEVIHCSVRDITERKQMEQQMRVLNAQLKERVVERTAQLQATKGQLQIAIEELEAFTYSVSHDLRAPIRHVERFATLLENEIGPSLSEANLRHLTSITQAANRMGKSIDALLAFARIGKDELQMTEVNLGVLVRETLGDFHRETNERNIAWEIHPLPAVRGDRALLRLVLDNLFSNAVKFTGPRAQPKIEIGRAPSRDGKAVIFIRDNGVGFDPRYADNLFGAFQRLHGQTEFEGTGLGLANVQCIIHRHGGLTWAESAVESGATFYFSIPTMPPPIDVSSTGPQLNLLP